MSPNLDDLRRRAGEILCKRPYDRELIEWVKIAVVQAQRAEAAEINRVVLIARSESTGNLFGE